MSEGLAQEVAAHGIRVAVVDVTAPDVASGPFRVVRAISPDLMALTFGAGMQRLAPARVAAMPIHGCEPELHPVW